MTHYQTASFWVELKFIAMIILGRKSLLFNYKARKEKMQEIENKMVIDSYWPKEKTIPDGVSGWYQPKDDEFIPDEDSFEYALENWDTMPAKKRQMFKQDLVDMFFGDEWERIKGD